MKMTKSQKRLDLKSLITLRNIPTVLPLAIVYLKRGQAGLAVMMVPFTTFQNFLCLQWNFIQPQRRMKFCHSQ
jgi:hypothetical protein